MKNNNNKKSVKKNNKVPLEKGFLNRIKVSYLATLMGFSLVTALGVYAYHENLTKKNLQKSFYVDEVKILGERLQKSSSAINSADSKAFLELETTANRLSKILDIIIDGGAIDSGVISINPSPNIASSESFKNLKSSWEESEHFIDLLLKQRNTILDLKNVAISSLGSFNEINSQAILVNQATERGTKEQQRVSKEMIFLINRVSFSMQELFGSSELSRESVYILIKDLRTLSKLIDSLENGNSLLDVEELNDENSQEALIKIKKLTTRLIKTSTEIQNNTDLLIMSKEIATKINKDNANLETIAEEMSQIIKAEGISLEIWRIIYSVAFLLSILSAIILSLVFYQKSLQALKMASVSEENRGNQNAVNELLNQLHPIDDGDFTRNIHVNDKFISPISAQVNKVRILFNEIVRQVKGTSEQVLYSAQGTEETSKRLLDISSEQYDKMSTSILSLGRITSEIDELSQTTFIAQEESKESREASIEGAKLVSESIKKMDSIRETIQESSKKIKKLGESAQAINEVTGLIQDITKQINVLALNAAIQAASTGEAGREFAIVAQEVQRLAEDSENATEKIAVIINEIQKDASTAVASMEKTTQEVVAGAQLTDQAGNALRKIETLADSVSKRVELASTDLEKKSEEMANFAFDMKQLQLITKESSETIVMAAKQVESLKEIAGSLEQSVSTYKV